MEVLEAICTVGRKKNGAAISENSKAIPSTVKIELPYDKAIPLLCISPEEQKAVS